MLFRGTMVVHDADDEELPFLESEETRLQARRRARRSARRHSDPPAVAAAKRGPSVWQVLLAVLFCLAETRPSQTQLVFDTLAGYTSSKRKLTEDEVLMIEYLFQSLHHELHPLFRSYVTEPKLRGDARALLEVETLVPTVTRIVLRSLDAGATAAERRDAMGRVAYLRGLLELSSERRKSVRRR